MSLSITERAALLVVPDRGAPSRGESFPRAAVLVHAHETAAGLRRKKVGSSRPADGRESRGAPSGRRTLPVEPTVRSLVVLTLDPGPQTAIEVLQALQIGLVEQRQELHAHGAEGDAKLAHTSAMLGAERRPVVHVAALGDTAAANGLLQRRQERRHVLREGKRGEGHHACGVVDERDEVRLLAPASAQRHHRPVHDVAHPELVGVLEREAATVLGLGRACRFEVTDLATNTTSVVLATANAAGAVRVALSMPKNGKVVLRRS
jgi:hypothetical protein